MTWRRPPMVLCGLMALVIAVGGCGGGVPDELTSRADRRLAPLVQQIRADLEAADPLTASISLSELRRLVARMRHDGSITDEHAAVVLAAAARVEDRLDVAPTSTTTPPPPARESGDEEDGQGEGDDGSGNGNGKAKGKDK